MQTHLQNIISLGQGLIQNASKGSNTKKLEDDLEGVSTKWNTLNKKVFFLNTIILVDVHLKILFGNKKSKAFLFSN